MSLGLSGRAAGERSCPHTERTRRAVHRAPEPPNCTATRHTGVKSQDTCYSPTGLEGRQGTRPLGEQRCTRRDEAGVPPPRCTGIPVAKSMPAVHRLGFPIQGTVLGVGGKLPHSPARGSMEPHRRGTGGSCPWYPGSRSQPTVIFPSGIEGAQTRGRLPGTRLREGRLVEERCTVKTQMQRKYTVVQGSKQLVCIYSSVHHSFICTWALL